MSVTIKLRRANASEWAMANIVLDLAEPGYEIDTGKLKIGDGITPWNNLQYIAGDGGSAVVLDENIDDRVANLLVAGTGISLTYNDSANSLTVSSSAVLSDNSNIPNSTTINNIVKISQTDYNNLSSYEPDTLYFVV
jgi:hypothetical protein